MQVEFATVGPMKNHIDKLTKILYDKDMALANEKIDCEQYRQRLGELTEENTALTQANENLQFFNDKLVELRDNTTN